MPIDITKPLSYFAKLTGDAVLAYLNVNSHGLTSNEAFNRIITYGKNTIKEEKKLHVIWQFLSGFKSPLVLMLVCVSMVSFSTGSVVDGIIILAMVFISAVLNFIQEYKAGNAARKLKERIENVSLVYRDGKQVELKNSDLCVGDVIEFNAGDLIPADCRVLSSKDFFVNQSVLTGESFPIEKFSAPIETDSNDLTKLQNCLFAGTSVITGSAMAVVLKTGSMTEFGKIAADLVAKEDENEFTRGVTKFSLMVLRVIVFFVFFIFFVNALMHKDIFESLLFSLAVAVGLTPEFLPMIMSVTMGRGSVSMAKKGVIVKKLSAIPTFGSLDVLCTDKTGTLTEDKIRVVKYISLDGEHSEDVLKYAFVNSSFQTGITNPMDEAIVNFKQVDTADFVRIDEIPFDFNRRRMSVVTDEKGKRLMITKGAPEEIFKVCKNYLMESKAVEMGAAQSDFVLKQYISLSNEGYRVIAVAIKELTDGKTTYEPVDENNLSLIGYIAFLDPPKEGVKETLDELERIGIEVKIITGDNELVAQKICQEVGVKIKGVIQGSEIRNMPDVTLRHKVNKITIFARFSPDDKNRVIRLLKENHHVVGYMGDGINDAPSLKTADVGISVSNAVDVAKEAADIILTQKTLEQLKDGVIEGRKTFGNTMKYIMMGISSNFGNMFSVLGAVLFIKFLPMLPIQILLNNFLYDISQVTIPTDNVDDQFTHKPKRWNMSFIKKFMFSFGPISSLFDFTTFGVMYMFYSFSPSHFQTGWFMESLATQTFVIYMIRTQTVPFFKSKPSRLLVLSTLFVVLVGWTIPYTPLGSFFGFSPLPYYVVIILILIVAMYMVCVEIGKKIFYKHVRL